MKCDDGYLERSGVPDETGKADGSALGVMERSQAEQLAAVDELIDRLKKGMGIVTRQVDEAAQRTRTRPAGDHVAANPFAVTLEEVIAHRRRVFEESTALIAKKGADYNRDQQKDGDTLFNLRVAALLGIVETPEQGILTRMSDKFMRIISLMKPGREPENQDESVRSTVHDLHNYLDYALLLWERSRRSHSDSLERLADKAVSRNLDRG